MKKEKINCIDRYHLCIKLIHKVDGSILILSLAYPLLYILVSFYLWSMGFMITDIQQKLYFIGFGLFLMAILFVRVYIQKDTNKKL